MSTIWSEEGKLARWLDVELAALDGWAEVGAIPAEDVAAIRAGAKAPTPERVVIPDAFLALDYMLDRFAWIVEGLVVHPDRMLANLEASHGLVFSHRLLLALVEAGLPRDEAYRRVQAAAMESWDSGADFRALAAADPEISSRLDAGAFAEVFDLDATVQHVDVVFERLHALTRKEPVNV